MATPAKRAPGSETDEAHLRLAVLIDADNAQATVIEALLAEVARFGDATVRRIYGDFTAPTSASWKKVLQRNAIKPVQQFAYSTGKNSTDSTLIIDAMDLLYTGNFDGFALVTSDSDFTRPGHAPARGGARWSSGSARRRPRRRSATPATDSCSSRCCAMEAPTSSPSSRSPTCQARAEPCCCPTAAKGTDAAAAAARPRAPKKFVLSALEQSVDDEGWAHLGTFGNYLNKLQPDFDPRLYGYKKLPTSCAIALTCSPPRSAARPARTRRSCT